MYTRGKRQIANNLTEVAQDLIAYVLSANKDELATIMGVVKNEYEQTAYRLFILNMIERAVYLYSRQRGEEVHTAQTLLTNTDTGNQLRLLEIVTDFLAKGNCDSTSANSLLLNKLIDKMNCYEPLEEEARLNKLGRNSAASRIGMREVLRNIFVTLASETISKLKKEIAATKTEKPVVNKLDIDPLFKHRLEMVLKPDAQVVAPDKRYLVRADNHAADENVPSPDSNIKNKYASLISELEILYKKKPDKKFKEETPRVPNSESFMAARNNMARFFKARVASPVEEEYQSQLAVMPA